MPAVLEIKNLDVSVEGRKILQKANLDVHEGEAHVLMGPNGSGKSTLAFCILGHPAYKVEGGEIIFKGSVLNDLKTDERARLGIFLGFQNPLALEGVSFFSLMQAAREAQNAKRKAQNMDIFELHNELGEKVSSLGLDKDFVMRGLNDGASGGERKKLEMAQAKTLKPRLAIFDEIDTGLDVDALKKMGEEISELKKSGVSVILITHYQRILNYVRPDKVHIMVDGSIVQSGGAELAEKINESGYSYLKCPVQT